MRLCRSWPSKNLFGLPDLPTLGKSSLIYWRLWLSSRLLPLQVGRKQLDAILELATPTGVDSTLTSLRAEDILTTIVVVTKKPWLMRNRRCLRQGVLGFRYLRLAGFDPKLHFSIAPTSVSTLQPRAHCWISLDGETVLNPPNEPMVDLFVYDGVIAGHAPEKLGEVEFADA